MRYSKTLLFIHPMCNSLHLLIPAPSPPPLPNPPIATASLFTMSVSLFLFCRVEVHLCCILESTINDVLQYLIHSNRSRWRAASRFPDICGPVCVHVAFLSLIDSHHWAQPNPKLLPRPSGQASNYHCLLNLPICCPFGSFSKAQFDLPEQPEWFPLQGPAAQNPLQKTATLTLVVFFFFFFWPQESCFLFLGLLCLFLLNNSILLSTLESGRFFSSIN